MVNLAEKTQRLTNVQAMLLQTFQFDLPEIELLEVKRVLSKHFAHKARMEADRLINEGVVTLKDLNKASKDIANHRGKYLKKIRGESSN